MIFPCIIPSLRRRGVTTAGAAALVCAAACGGGTPTAPIAPVGPPALALTCPANVEVSSLGGAPVAVNYTAPVANGGSAPVNVTCNPTPGTTFPSGSSAVACTAQDSAGQNATCSFTVNVQAIPRLSRTRFMTFGDSLTEGKVSLTPSMLVDSPSHSYPAKLLRLLTERYTGQQVTVLNEGFGGERAEGSIDRFQDAMDRHQPEAVLLMHGVNDLNGVGDGRVQAAVDGVEELVKEARGRGAVTFVASIPPLGPPKGSCPECVEPFNARVRNMAAAKGAIFVDVYEAWRGKTGLMGADGIHPTEAGYEVIANTFFEAIRRTLESSPPNQ